MIVSIDLPFADVRAGSLRYSVAPERHDALVEHALKLAGYRLELRVLGHSHQAIAAGPNGSFHETLACLERAAGSARPERFAHELARDRYEFESSLDRPGRAGVEARAREVTAALAADPHAVVAAFPGLDGAITALAATRHEHGIAWTSHHLYPQAGEIVTTRSRVLPRR